MNGNVFCKLIFLKNEKSEEVAAKTDFEAFGK